MNFSILNLLENLIIEMEEQKEGVKTAPSKPLSPFILFSQQERRKIKREHPELRLAVIVKKVKKRW